VDGWIGHLFGFVCGQDPFHTWAPGGTLLPFCQRCTGFYAGAAIALALQAALWLRPGARFLQVHGLFLLLMIPFGFHWLPQGALLRTLLGLLYGFGVVSFLWLWPGVRLGAVRGASHPKLALYAAGVVVGLVAVPALSVWGSRAAARTLVGLALLGLAGVAALVLANLGIGLVSLASRATRHTKRVAS
jgi:uncharacterized membrane protein